MNAITPHTDKTLWIKIIIGMILGFGLGVLLSPSGVSILDPHKAIELGRWIALPGIIFLGLLKMIVIPLIISSVVLGIASCGNMAFLRNMGLRIVPYFLITTFIAISIGVTTVHVIDPAQYMDQTIAEATLDYTDAPAQIFDDLSIPDRIENLIPTNFTQASLEKNMLQIVIFSIILGIIMLSIGKATSEPFEKLCVFAQAASMKVIEWAMVLAPYAVFGLITKVTIELGVETILGVGAYMASVLVALFVLFLFYLLVVSLLGKRSPFAFLAGAKEAQLLAFSTSSSAATMPFTLKAAEENLKIKEKVSRFIIPLGATINMDGTALYQAVAALFLCSLFGVDFTTPEIFLLMITTVGASIGTPATPGVGIIVLATILSSIGVPPEGIGIILGVDRLLDMCRTTLNVTGDLVASTVMDRWMK
ncbi:MAG: dicarboxylate/amino acid:cation symporter [Pseudomonadota bacterium]